MTPQDGGVPLDFTTSASTEPEIAPVSAPFSEDALALQFTARHGHELRYVHSWGKWMRWTGEVWQQESTMLAFDAARQVCRDNLDLPGCTESMKRSLCHAATVAGVVKMASADRQHAATSEQWDSDLWRLNTPTGTIDLTTGRLLKHNPLDYHSKITAAGISDRKPERWLQFLDRIFEDKEIPKFLQRIFGYSLTGSTQEHSLFFCFGTGRNGKSVLTSTIAAILGDYAREAALETFTESRESHPTGLAGLVGTRLALVRETEKGSYWAESKLKACTGGDRLTARLMRQDFFDFSPQFKLLVTGNQKPRLRSVDEAIRRRMNIIPFTVTIPPEECDPKLFEKLKSEWGGILKWMVDGCLEWQRNGLQAPESVRVATETYLCDEDKVGRWIEERCIAGPNETAAKTAAYKDFQRWCTDGGEVAPSRNIFTQELTARSIDCDSRSSTTRLIRGISLVGDPVEESFTSGPSRW
jgi:putative DNA primase/helicase